MVKETGFTWRMRSFHKHNYLSTAVILLLIGLSFRLFICQSGLFSPVRSISSIRQVAPAATPDPLKTPETGGEESLSGKCNIFTGQWVPNPGGPIYTNESCHTIEGHQNCMRNGRPDSDYLYWRWKPENCILPQFDPWRFLDAMRNKYWAFVGDSISRNHVQSLLCILSQVEEADEVYHDEKYSSKMWHFWSHNFTVLMIWSPFLIKAETFEDENGVAASEIQLHLDSLDPNWTNHYVNFDYMVISGGKWFLKTAIYYEKDKMIGCHYCPGKNLTELGFEYAYMQALHLVFTFIATSGHRSLVLFRTSTPDHFENGEWFSGGTCKRKTPFRDGEISMKDMDKILRDIELEKFEEAKALASESRVDIRLLDTAGLSLLRPDGHPGPYREFHPFIKEGNVLQSDCLHWCLPGPIDSWNELMMEMVLGS